MELLSDLYNQYIPIMYENQVLIFRADLGHGGDEEITNIYVENLSLENLSLKFIRRFIRQFIADLLCYILNSE